MGLNTLRLILLLALLAVCALFLHALLVPAGEEEENPREPGSGQPLFLTAKDCENCHPEVYAEWRTSIHSQAWTDPEVRRKDASDNFANKDCIPCHAPSPILETGLGNPPLPRFLSREEGVNCLSCHMENGRVKGKTPGITRGCFPEPDPRVGTAELCGICHNQHQTVDEWKESRFSREGVGCLSCHMPERVREGGRGGRDHTLKGGHFPDRVRKAVTLHGVQEEPGKVILVVKNLWGGHYVPTDARHRAMDLAASFFDREGNLLERPEIFKMQDGGEGRFLAKEYFAKDIDYRFRNPYRDEFGLKDTRLKADEERSFLYSLPAGAFKVEARLFYKLTPYTPNNEAFLMAEVLMEGLQE